MSLHIMYVEDRQRDVNLLGDALSEANKGMPKWSCLRMENVKHPSGLKAALQRCSPDVVLADVYFQPEGTSPPEPETDHLEEILKDVREWDQGSPHGFPTPVIAYTSTGTATLKSCLGRRKQLYDILDKLSASPDYVAWRFQQLAAELPRHRPDATIQKLVAGMVPADCPSWHGLVLNLVRTYGEGRTEREQMRMCKAPIREILDAAVPDCAQALVGLWDALVGSEPLLRAASPRLRGIGRHSINVFWLGYWLINHPRLKDRLATLWSTMLDNRSNAAALKTENATAGMNRVWLLASLFHDAGKFHEYASRTTSSFADFFGKFESLGMGRAEWREGTATALLEGTKKILNRLSDDPESPLVQALTKHIAACSKQQEPDHGAVAAVYLESIMFNATSRDDLHAYGKEAARAALLHSCLPSAFDGIPNNKPSKHLRLGWNTDPVASLLLFCDQIQTWDRHDPDDEKLDYPDRAELCSLEVVSAGSSAPPCLTGCIDYIAPSRVSMYPQLREDIAGALNGVILGKPKNALLHVLEREEWPFRVQLDCALSGERLSVPMDFPIPREEEPQPADSDPRDV